MKITPNAFRLSALLAICYITQPGIIYSCGPFTPTAILSFQRTPDTPLASFVKGDLGIIHPGLRTSYLFVAYRYLVEQPLNKAEQGVLQRHWRTTLGPNEQDTRAWRQWMRVRSRITSGKKDFAPNREFGAYYFYYLNCHDDAFRNASETLLARIKSFGAQSAGVKDWVNGQDMVFANCESGKTIPSPVPPDFAPIFRADRAYQVAAANFYAGDFETAEAGFRSIASDASSPWSGIAPYLQARAVIRKALLSMEQDGPDASSRASMRTNELQRASALLRDIVADPSRRPYHRMARERLGLIEARLHPRERLRQLSTVLSRPRSSDLLAQELNDLLYLVDRNPDQTADLADWIQTMNSLAEPPRRKAAALHALQRWHQRHTLPWLVAATAVDRSSLSDALLDAVNKVSASSSARLTMAFVLTRGGRDKDQAAIQALLAVTGVISDSTANHLSRERFRNARDFMEFKQALPRRVADTVWYEEDENLFKKYGAPEDFLKPKVQRTYLLDADGARALNRRLPLAMLAISARDTSLPQEIRRDVAIAAWTKAVLLDRTATADDLVPLLSDLVPELRPYLHDYQAETETERKRFAAYFAILNFPGMSPLLHSDYGRQALFAQIDNYRRNWWCGKGSPTYAGERTGMPEDPGDFYGLDETASSALGFLAAAEQGQAEAEWAKLTSLETGPNLLAKSVLAYRDRFPADSRLPNALDLSLRALRYGCSDAAYNDLSHRVFRTLHSKYPKSRAAKRNRPWG